MSGVFLVSSDIAMNKIAKTMNIKVVNPENESVKKLEDLIRQKKAYPRRKISRIKRKFGF